MIEEEIREILLKSWDPLGVGDNEHLASEYDGYVREIKEALLSGANEAEITNMLMLYDKDLGAETPEYGFSNPVAKKLFSLRPTSR